MGNRPSHHISIKPLLHYHPAALPPCCIFTDTASRYLLAAGMHRTEIRYLVHKHDRFSGPNVKYSGRRKIAAGEQLAISVGHQSHMPFIVYVPRYLDLLTCMDQRRGRSRQCVVRYHEIELIWVRLTPVAAPVLYVPRYLRSVLYCTCGSTAETKPHLASPVTTPWNPGTRRPSCELTIRPTRFFLYYQPDSGTRTSRIWHCPSPIPCESIHPSDLV